MRVIIATVFPALCLAATAAFGGVWYVDQDNASGTEDGTSWATAFVTIQEGIDAAYGDGGGEVWVAEGVYGEVRTSVVYPPPYDQNTGSVVMKEYVHLYGGFAGGETARDQRDWEAHVTTIDGLTARDGEPAYHVVIGCNNATLDGFTVTGGRNLNLYEESPPGGKAVEDAPVHGPGMYNVSASPTVANCLFTRNVTTVSLDVDDHYAKLDIGMGGGIYNDGASPTVTDCVFAVNTALAGGGGICNANSSSPTVTDCAFTENTANGWYTPWEGEGPPVGRGGGLYNDSSSSPVVVGCAFTANRASLQGGGLSGGGEFARVTDCTFVDNSAYGVDYFEDLAVGRGGGVHTWGAATVERCVFAGNFARYRGGGIHVDSGIPTIVNCVFASNVADGSWQPFGSAGEGGAIYGDAHLVNCSFTLNEATYQGGALAGATPDTTAVNCILWDDIPEELDPASAPVITYSDVAGGYAGEGNVATDPQFEDAAAGDLRLAGGSPCIDAGTAEGAPGTDLVGIARPQGGGVDMGAYEWEISAVLQSSAEGWLEEGEPLTLEVMVIGMLGEVAYTWYKDGFEIYGATDAVFEIPAVALEDTGSYRCVVTDESKGSYPTNAVYVAVYTAGSLPAVGTAGLGVLALIALVMGPRGLARLGK